jgi:hypothetical protein
MPDSKLAGTWKVRKLVNSSGMAPKRQERTELPPRGHRAVHDPARQQIGEGVPQSDDEEHGADGGRGDAGHVGVVVQHERGAQAEGQIECEVTRAVPMTVRNLSLSGEGICSTICDMRGLLK